MSQESKIDPAIIKKSQDTLGRLIQAPSLTEKLLNRPPVQFIQDIVKSVIKNTGFMKGLYPQDELEASFIKSSKENKLLFLNKLIIAVGIAIGEQLSAKANKIAAGVEAEKTNELFQALAKAINMKPDNDEIVKKTLKKLKSMDSAEDKNDKEDRKEKPRDKNRDEEKESRDRTKTKTEESGKSRDKDREKDRERDKERERKDRDRSDREKDRERDKDRERKDRDRGDREKDRERDKDRERKDRDRGDREKDRERDKDRERKDRDRSDREKGRDRDRDREKEKDRKDKERHKDKDRKERDQEKPSDREERERDKELRKEKKESRKTEEQSRHRRNSNDEVNKENHRSERAEEELSSRKNDDDSEENSNRRRPSSARGPRIQIDRDEIHSHRSQTETLEDNRSIARPTTARPGAPRPKINNESNETPVKVGSAAKKPTLIVHDDSDSDGDFVVKENNFQDDEQKNWKGLDDFKKPGDEEQDEKHGALVTKILESKGKLEHGNELHKSSDQKPTIQMDLQRKKERERTQKEIDKLKDSIQTLTKASIPLGRTLDFLQEDIDMMQKEIVKWSDEYDSNCRVLKRQKAEMQNFIEPYKEALRQIENQIAEQMDRIGTVKRNILLNEEKISRLIFNIGKS